MDGSRAPSNNAEPSPGSVPAHGPFQLTGFCAAGGPGLCAANSPNCPVESAYHVAERAAFLRLGRVREVPAAPRAVGLKESVCCRCLRGRVSSPCCYIPSILAYWCLPSRKLSAFCRQHLRLLSGRRGSSCPRDEFPL